MLARFLVVTTVLSAALMLSAAIQKTPTPTPEEAPAQKEAPAKPTASFASEHVFLDEAGEPTKLSDIADGHPLAVIVIKGTHCRVCRAELRRLEDRAAELARLGVRVVAVSADTPDAHGQMKANLDLRFRALTDPSGRALKQLSMWMDDADMPLPGVIFLDRCGDIAGVYRGRRPGSVQTPFIIGGLEDLAQRSTCGQSA